MRKEGLVTLYGGREIRVGRVGRGGIWDTNCNIEISESVIVIFINFPTCSLRKTFFPFNELFKVNIHMVKIHIVAKKVIQ